jgi:Na+-translocating ferredoxin:NAD+ oxidoreductase RNF subunit RnfB
MVFVTAVATLGGLTLLLATVLAIANARLRVEEDPRIDAVESMLPLSNCGACGYPGCRAFAEALVTGSTTPAGCTVNSAAGREAIAEYLGVDVGAAVKRVARLACAGGDNVALQRANYRGEQTCLAAAQVAGGGKGCFWGCLGLADCARACDFDAIHMNAQALPVVDPEKCTACNDCVMACPKDLFSLQRSDHHLWVACKNEERGDEILANCRVACTACERCAMDAPGGLITMRGNLPRVDYRLPQRDDRPIQRCPTGAIVWMDSKEHAHRGDAAGPIVRHSPLPPASS